jgi:MYM-type Zinc finger with FCS sequence motif
VTEALSWTHPPVGRAVETPPRGPKLRCSFCRAELGDAVELTISKDGQGRSTGSFCSAHCRNCVLALAALHPSPLASDDFVSRRGVLTDRLLDLWRHGRGPDPVLVLRAAEHVSCGLPSVDSVVPTAEPSVALRSPALREAASWGRGTPLPRQ